MQAQHVRSPIDDWMLGGAAGFAATCTGSSGLAARMAPNRWHLLRPLVAQTAVRFEVKLGWCNTTLNMIMHKPWTPSRGASVRGFGACVWPNAALQR